MEDYSMIQRELIAISNFAISTYQNIQKRVYPQQFASSYGYIISYICDNEDKNIFQRDIEREFKLNRSTVSNILTELEKEGLVERKAVTTDARLKKIVVTQGAKMINDACNREIVKMLTDLFEGISDEEIVQLTSILSRLRLNSEDLK